MKIEKLILENFRQFRGRQELVFATDDEQNITLVHAENGFGKTALLNALLWGFYGHKGLSEDFPKKENIINSTEAAIARDPDLVEAAVTILFEHEGVHYTLRRSLTLAQQKVDSKKTDLQMEFIRDGQPFQQAQPQQRIESFMPFGISSLLFFNGERIDHLAMEENASRVTDAIHQMLGLKLLKSAIADLRHQSVRGKLRAELREKTSDEKKALLDRQAAIDEAVDLTTQRKSVEEENLANAAVDLAKVEDKLAANRTVHELQKKRKDLEVLQKAQNERKAEMEKKLAKIISEDGFSLFVEELTRRGRDLVRDLRAKKAIPARVLNSFIEELLEANRCICCRPLEAGTEERKAVETQLSLAGDLEFNNAVGALDNALGFLENGRARTAELVTETNRERIKLEEDLIEIGEEITALSKRIKNDGRDDEEATELEAERDRLLQRERECNSEIHRLEGRLQQLSDERHELTRKIEQLSDQEAAAQLAQRRLDAVEHAADLMEEVLQTETEELRPLLNDEIRKHFKEIIDQPFWPELSEDFVLSVKERITSEDLEDPVVLEVGPSTGQRQVTSLVFIASLVALAKQRAKIPTILRGLTGSEYPIVMDSPFGSLSTRFREGVAQWIPSLAPQVLGMVSRTQFYGAVEQTFGKTKKVGRRYYFQLHGPGLIDREGDRFELNGVDYQQYFEEPEKRTVIVEIEE
jgi:DNA sulfur modification protein DndD